MSSASRHRPELERIPGERRFRSAADLRYLLDRAATHPHVLLVVFAAMHQPDEPPPYHYRGTVSRLGCHRLFILDEHGPDDIHPRPTWYLGRAPRFEVAESVCELVAGLAGELGVDRRAVVTCGTSKGGWAALYFAAALGAGHAIAGEPQTFLGRYLVNTEHKAIAEHITGGSSATGQRLLDTLLFEALSSSTDPPEVHLYCGARSPYYSAEVAPLAAYLNATGIRYELVLGDHADHVPDLGEHFQPYLVRRTASLIEELRAAAPGGED